VETLAARLGVTKGSFYWHFKGRSELLADALGRWEHRVTTEAITGLSAVTDPRQRLSLMLDAGFAVAQITLIVRGARRGR